MIIHPQFGICLDAGSGIGPKRPAKGFTSHCDIIVPRPGDVVPEDYHVAPLEDLSCYKTKQFDYVRCWHALEHTNDPAKACEEIMRVGKAGIFGLPKPQACILFGRSDHNFLVFLDRGRLLIIRKRFPTYGVPRSVTRCDLAYTFEWEGSFEYQVVN